MIYFILGLYVFCFLIAVFKIMLDNQTMNRNSSLEENNTKFLKANLNNKFQTNHNLHFILSMTLMGAWILPWIMISQSNKNNRAKT